MRRNCVFLVLLICLISIDSKAQVIIKGTVVDSLGNNLQNVTVSVINTETSAVKGFNITNSKGYFEIKLATISNSTLRVTSIGYQSIEKVINENILTYNFKLNSGTYSLPEVLVKSQNLLSGKGDTLNYNVQQFVKTQDRTIGDVIKNLPGISISPTGTISYNGKAINKFYIDGDDLLGDKYALGVNTLPADIVTTVQVLENHQPIKMLEDRVFSESAAINIKIKDSEKLRIFGSGNITSGLPFNSSDARLNTLSFKKKLKFINTYSFNNIGGDLASEVISQNTNLPWQQQIIITEAPQLNFTYLPNPIIPYKYFTNNSTHLGSLNGLIPISNDKSLRLNFSYLPDNNFYNTKYTNLIFLQGDTVKQIENQNSNVRNDRVLLNATYLLNARNKYIQNKLVFENVNVNGNSNIENEINMFSQKIKNITTRFENSFSLKKVNKNESYIEVLSILAFNKNPQNLNIGLGIYPWFINNDIDFKETNQYLNSHLFSLKSEVSISKKIKKYHLSLKAEHLLEKNTFLSGLHLLQSNNEITDAESSFQNQFNWFQQQLTISPSIEYLHKKFKLLIAIPTMLRDLKYKEDIIKLDTNVWRLSTHPSLRLIYTLNEYSKLVFNYKRETAFTNQDKLLKGAILINYRNIIQNSQSIQFSNLNTLALNYSYRNPIKINFFSSSIIYSRNYSPVISSQFFVTGLVQNNQLLFNNITKRWMLTNNYSKYLSPLKTTLKLNNVIMRINYFQMQNEVINHLQNNSNSTTITIITKPVWYFNNEVSINYTSSISKNRTNRLSNGQTVNILNANLISTINFAENSFLQFENSCILQKNRNNNAFLTDIRFNYVIPKTKTDLGIKCINLFDQNRYITNDANGIQFATNDYWIRPFTLLLTSSFRF